MIATTMARCLHIYDNGFQCLDETLEATDLCESHQKVVSLESERLQDSWTRRAILRLVAFILLITLFIAPLLYSLRNLRWGPPAEAREVW